MTDLSTEEYQTLRKEVETAMSELNSLESSALFGVAGIFAWLVTHKSEGIVYPGWFIPIILVVFCSLRAWSINRHLGWLGEYLKRHESAGIRSELPGWEHFLAESPGRPEKPLRGPLGRMKDFLLEPLIRSNGPRRGLRGRITSLFWGVLLATTLAGGIAGAIHTTALGAADKVEARNRCLLQSSAGARDRMPSWRKNKMPLWQAGVAFIKSTV
jgi:hypothetical protein